jgi:hypothetical protein
VKRYSISFVIKILAVFSFSGYSKFCELRNRDASCSRMNELKRKIAGDDELKTFCNKRKRTSFKKLPRECDELIVLTQKSRAKTNFASRRKGIHVSKASFTQNATGKFRDMFVLIYMWEEYFDSKGVRHFGPNRCEFGISCSAALLRNFNFSFFFWNRCCTILVDFERTIASSVTQCSDRIRRELLKMGERRFRETPRPPLSRLAGIRRVFLRGARIQ